MTKKEDEQMESVCKNSNLELICRLRHKLEPRCHTNNAREPDYVCYAGAITDIMQFSAIVLKQYITLM